MTYLKYIAFATVAAIVVSPTIAGFAARASVALPLFLIGVIDAATFKAVVDWHAF